MLETQKNEELMDLVLKLNDQLKKTEKELDNLIKSKQSELSTTPQTVIPIVSIAAPSTLATTLAPMLPPATVLPVTGTTSGIGISTITKRPLEKIRELIKAME